MSAVLGALLVIVAMAVAAGCAVTLVRRSERRQARAMERARREAQRDSQRQARAILRLGAQVGDTARQIEALSAAMEARQDRLRRTMDERISAMSQDNERRLEQMRQTVSEKLDERLSESFRTVNGQLAGVHRGLGEMRELALGVTDLRRMLIGVKTRGVWGEVQLRGLLGQLFTPDQLVENAAIPEGSQTRVEFALRLVGAQGEAPLLPIDSKFPQEDYLRLVEAAEAGDAEQARRCGIQLERAVLEQARQIHDKYIRPPQTVDFAVLFLPTESLYAEVARRAGVIERAQEKYRVMICGPATLCAMLTSVQMGLRSCALEKRSGEVLRLLSGMKQDFARYDECVQRTRARLAQIDADLDQLDRQARKALKAMEGLNEEGAPDAPEA